MRKPDHVTEIFLQPGDFYFGDQNTRIRTLLGSCVSITMWHPQRLLGGMCHYMLPYASRKKILPQQYKLDGRYADEAILMFFREAARYETDPGKYVVKVFGGGKMFPASGKKHNTSTKGAGKMDISECSSVSCKNVAVIRSLARQYGFHIAAENLGGEGHRNVIFDIWSGHVWVKQPLLQNIV